MAAIAAAFPGCRLAIPLDERGVLMVVGGGNSAVIASLERLEAGARVSLVHRRPEIATGVT